MPQAELIAGMQVWVLDEPGKLFLHTRQIVRVH
jgi:hypothetical protein